MTSALEPSIVTHACALCLAIYSAFDALEWLVESIAKHDIFYSQTVNLERS